MRIQTKRFAVLISLTLASSSALLPTQPALAKDNEGHSLVHAGIAFGAWASSFSQEGGGQEMSLRTDVAPVIHLSFGMDIGPVFVEYAPVIGFAYLDLRDMTGREEADDVSTWSLVSFNAGVRIPLIHLMPYVGFGNQHYDFRYGTDVDFTGRFIRAGLGIDLLSKEFAHIDLRAEYQRVFIDEGGAGEMPDGYSTRANVWMLLLGVRWGG